MSKVSAGRQVRVGAIEDPASAASMEPMIQALRVLVMALSVERGECPVVRRWPACDADPGAVEEEAQPDGDHQGQDQDGHVVVGDPDRPEDQGLVVEEGRERPIGRGFQTHCAMPKSISAMERVTTSLEASDTPSSRRITPASITMPMMGASTKRQTNMEGRTGQPQPMVSCQLEEGADHPDGAVRPVEDAGRRVREREAARGYRVNARRSQSADGEDDELMHSCPPTE